MKGYPREEFNFGKRCLEKDPNVIQKHLEKVKISFCLKAYLVKSPQFTTQENSYLLTLAEELKYLGCTKFLIILGEVVDIPPIGQEHLRAEKLFKNYSFLKP